VYLFFHAYINEIHGSRSKFTVKNLVRQRYAEGFNSGVKGLMSHFQKESTVKAVNADQQITIPNTVEPLQKAA
jgi:hypothetical protein